MSRKFHLLICLLTFFAIVSQAVAQQSVAGLLDEANQNYNEGRYDTAVTLYREAIRNGADNGHVQYNLGNAYYRLGDIGYAIVSYRRALFEFPRDPDIIANIQLVRKDAVDKIDDSQGAVKFRGLLFLNANLSSYEMGVTFFCLYFIFWTSLVAFLLKRNSATKTIAITSLLLAMFWGFFTFGVLPGRDGQPELALTSSARELSPAVVVVEKANIYSGNAETFQVVFVLHDGAEIQTGEQRQDWIEVVLPQGRRGWTKTELLSLI